MSRHAHSDRQTCQVCGQVKPTSQMLPAALVRPQFMPIIRRRAADWSEAGYICFTCLDEVREEYVRELLERDLGELDSLEREVVESLKENELLAENINEEYERRLTLGDRIADRVAEFGGSWTFIFAFTAVLVA